MFVGAVGDRIGWRRIVTIFGTFGCAVATLILYYVPLAVGNDFAVAVACAMLWGFMLAGYTPLPPLLLAMGKEEERGSAFAIYCLAAGLATFVGPALVAVFQSGFGTKGVVWSLTALHLASIPMGLSLRSDKDPEFRRKADA
ncbi:MFS transporter [Saccharopolyspora erythraea]|uniref:Alpha-ketoglutarate permease n=2 Tax=Saccharopolyspora erythraea TaxID=1836 RepID=A4FCM5_SACEN|nr:MFS transporter [Saccharopolyspora erythraea]EQD87456.1 major facilitator transporter [Saccharopolyspora erythraea D]QRK92180.1 MFS transporter [Saccharopolyspora erythraea]CAM01800.1 alpha-ketoglutarate permease [Saccharopolyspora erythraea NRRL 2338]